MDDHINEKLREIINSRRSVFEENGIRAFFYEDQISLAELPKITSKSLDEFKKFCKKYHQSEAQKIRSILEGHSFVKRGNNTSDYGVEYTADFFLREVRRTNLESAVKSLSRVWSGEPTTLQNVIILVGVSCEKEISLANHIKIVPLEQLAFSYEKDRFLQFISPKINDPISASALMMNNVDFWHLPRCALVAEDNNYPTSPLNRKDFQSTYEKHRDIFEHLHEFSVFITSAIDGVALVEASWQQTNDADLNRWRKKWGNVGDNFQFETSNPKKLPDSNPLNPSLLKELYEKYIALDVTLKQQLKLSLHHLLLSRCFRYPEDQIINLAISLESLLLNRKDPAKSEFLALRAALIAEEDIEKRKEIKSTFKNFYDHRSDLVHNGQLKTSRDEKGKKYPPNIIANVNQVADCAARIIQKILQENKIPNWELAEISQENIWI